MAGKVWIVPLNLDTKGSRSVVYCISSESNFARASFKVGGATDHIVTNGSAGGMKRWCRISEVEEKVIKSDASGTRHPVK